MIPRWARIALLAVINFAAAAYGFYYYYSAQFALTPMAYWFFIPDCALYTLFFGVVVLLYLFKVKRDWLDYLVSVGVLKYGLWTVGIYLFRMAEYGLHIMSEYYTIIFILHIGMVLEAFVLVPRKISLKPALIVLAWFVFNDFMDYMVPIELANGMIAQGTHTFLSPSVSLWFTAGSALLLTVISCTLVYHFSKHKFSLRKLFLLSESG
jgi:uncharacterized membrane protein YpjA